jgi:hypothetical protein
MLHVNDREPLVREYCALVCVYSAPVRSAVSDGLSHLKRTVAYQFERFLEIENPNKAAQSNHLIIASIVTAASPTKLLWSFLAEGLRRSRSLSIRNQSPIPIKIAAVGFIAVAKYARSGRSTESCVFPDELPTGANDRGFLNCLEAAI